MLNDDDDDVAVRDICEYKSNKHRKRKERVYIQNFSPEETGFIVHSLRKHKTLVEQDKRQDKTM